MLRRLLHLPADIEVWIAIPVGCLVPLALAIAVAVGIGVVIGTVRGQSNVSSADHVVVRVIDDGAKGGAQIVATTIVPLH
jgi:hypothetical protein